MNNTGNQAARVPSITDGGFSELILVDVVEADVTDVLIMDSGAQLVPDVDNMVTSTLDIPLNNSSRGLQFTCKMTFNVPSMTEVSNNSGLQFVPEVAITVTSDLEVLSNNSSVQQFVPEVAITGSSDLEVPNNSSVQQDGNNGGDFKLAVLAGVTEFGTGIAALLKKPPSSDDSIYLVFVAIVLTVSVVKALAAFWVEGRTSKRIIWFVSIAMIILGILLNIYAHKA